MSGSWREGGPIRGNIYAGPRSIWWCGAGGGEPSQGKYISWTAFYWVPTHPNDNQNPRRANRGMQSDSTQDQEQRVLVPSKIARNAQNNANKLLSLAGWVHGL
eukprot:2593121-Amphidinium_carterae.1